MISLLTIYFEDLRGLISTVIIYNWVDEYPEPPRRA